MDAKRPRQNTVYRPRIKLLVLLLGLLIFAELALTQTDNQEIRVKIYTSQLGADGEYTPLSNATVKVGPSTVTTDATGASNAVVPRGKHNVKAYLQGFVVSEMSISPTATGMDYGTATAYSDDGDIEFSFLSRSTSEEADKDYTLFVRLKPGTPKTKGKDVSVMLISEECKSPPVWDRLGVRIGEAEFDAKDMDASATMDAGLKTKKVELRPGQQEISIISADFPKTVILRAYVMRMYYSDKAKSWNTKIMLSYEPEDTRSITVDLAENLWEQRDGFQLALALKIWGNCEDPKTDPKEFGIFTVKAVSGLVEAKQPPYLLYGKKQESSFIKADVDKRYGEGTTIRTGENGLIILESEYKHTITIDNSTEVKLSTLATPSGRRQLKALMEKGKIKVERKSDDSKGDSVTTSVETKTASVNSTQTIYTVSYDETAKLTTVGVSEGEVEVFPTNQTLQPVTLTALQQIQVAENKVGSVTAFVPDSGSSKTGKILLYIGIGFLSLLILFGLFLFFRKQQRLVWQPAHHPTWGRPAETHTPPISVSPP